MLVEAKDGARSGGNWSYKSCKTPVKSSTNHHQQTNTQFFTGRMPFLSPNQQGQSTKGKISHSMDLLTPSPPGGLPTLSLTTNNNNNAEYDQNCININYISQAINQENFVEVVPKLLSYPADIHGNKVNKQNTHT